MGVVRYLLDTHTFLWAMQKDMMLSNTAKTIMDDKNTQFFVSAVSAYEIMYKHKLGKLDEYKYVAENYFDVLHEFGADKLPISEQHAHLAGKFEWAHRDPFDRLLAAQASTENLTLITNDPAFETLPWVKTLW